MSKIIKFVGFILIFIIGYFMLWVYLVAGCLNYQKMHPEISCRDNLMTRSVMYIYQKI